MKVNSVAGKEMVNTLLFSLTINDEFIVKYSTGPYQIDKICGCIAVALRFL